MNAQIGSPNGGVVIVGGGLAGLFCALKLAPHPVTLLTRTVLGHGASAWAQGGIAAAIGDGDTPEAHAADTMLAGAGIVDPDIARLIAEEAGQRICDLLDYGVPFDRDLEGKLALSREAAHRARRIVRVRGDLAGKAIMEALTSAVRRTASIRVIEGWALSDLVCEAGTVRGVKGRSNSGTVQTIRADAVVLATGGIGHLFAVTTNPLTACGDGLGAAARSGAVLADTEFVQFHPTGIDIGRDPAPLATEALRGDGAVLVNGRGERFMAALHPDAELGPRDVVARGVFAEIAAGRGAFLDARDAIGARFPERFPGVYAICREAGLDPVRDLIPVAPAAHYHMGGVATDRDGRTSLKGLWACGEVACTGAHGANRLASNSLLEAVVFGARIAEDIRSLAMSSSPTPAEASGPPADIPVDAPDVWELRQMMSRHVGVLRSEDGLVTALQQLRALETGGGSDSLRNLATIGVLVAAGALLRRESRGGHARTDFPEASAQFARRSFFTLDEARNVADRAGIPASEAAE
ncbi:L-aspartate oxidase [Terrihabitans rhizophilus]|uniref:L-aspartate oxidase n=1 Tax=Terrihabitans rhizophilus TaxID=3092662 RepID=A0ABU4RKE0_9HYPH|nr:L-aspartate oxidase [Terrihabitans sp. PJ23]MDX6805292.1 L-aspartate oxidase [Terrihabitans sp. PJ23]